jgi:hypothetical protein
MPDDPREPGRSPAPPGCSEPELGAQLDRLDEPDVDEVTRARIEEHVAECPACGEELELRLEIGEAFRAEESTRTPSRRRSVGRGLIGLAAALALFALALPFLVQKSALEVRLEPATRSIEEAGVVVPADRALDLQLLLTAGREGERREVVVLDAAGETVLERSARVEAPPPRLSLNVPEGLERPGRYTVIVSDADGGALSEDSFTIRVVSE